MSTQYPPVSIHNTEQRTLRSSITGFEYRINVALPYGYARSGKTYPVLYGLDADWLFGSIIEVIRLLVVSPEISPMILIGLGFPLSEFLDYEDTQPFRERDFVPPGWLDYPGCSGGAEDFLRFIREDLIPFIGSEYRVDLGERGYVGDSLGGLFGLYVLFSHPDTFNRYIIGSPWAEKLDPVLQAEREFAVTHTDLPAKVFMGAGSLEPEFMSTVMQSLERTLTSRGYPNLGLHMQIFEGETHCSVAHYNLCRGIKVVYESGTIKP